MKTVTRTPKKFPCLEVAGAGGQMVVTALSGHANHSDQEDVHNQGAQAYVQDCIVSADGNSIASADQPTTPTGQPPVPALISVDGSGQAGAAPELISHQPEAAEQQPIAANYSLIAKMPSYARFVGSVDVGSPKPETVKTLSDLEKRTSLNSYTDALVKSGQEPTLGVVVWKKKNFKALRLSKKGSAAMWFTTHEGKHGLVLPAADKTKSSQIYQIDAKVVAKDTKVNAIDTLLTYFAAWNGDRSKSLTDNTETSITVMSGKPVTGALYGSRVSISNKSLEFQKTSACGKSLEKVEFKPVDVETHLKAGAESVVGFINGKPGTIDSDDAYKAAAALFALGDSASAKQVLLHPTKTSQVVTGVQANLNTNKSDENSAGNDTEQAGFDDDTLSGTSADPQGFSEDAADPASRLDDGDQKPAGDDKLEVREAEKVPEPATSTSNATQDPPPTGSETVVAESEEGFSAAHIALGSLALCSLVAGSGYLLLKPEEAETNTPPITAPKKKKRSRSQKGSKNQK